MTHCAHYISLSSLVYTMHTLNLKLLSIRSFPHLFRLIMCYRTSFSIQFKVRSKRVSYSLSIIHAKPSKHFLKDLSHPIVPNICFAAPKSYLEKDLLNYFFKASIMQAFLTIIRMSSI